MVWLFVMVQIWGMIQDIKIDFQKFSDNDLCECFMFIQYQVMQYEGIERVFIGEYWDYDEDGIYVDVVLGELLFFSFDKYDVGCGWFSFIQFIFDVVFIENIDYKIGYVCIEVCLVSVDFYFGYVFFDGLCDWGGLCYCINLVVLCFVLLSEFDVQGYGQYCVLFEGCQG